METKASKYRGILYEAVDNGLGNDIARELITRLSGDEAEDVVNDLDLDLEDHDEDNEFEGVTFHVTEVSDDQ